MNTRIFKAYSTIYIYKDIYEIVNTCTWTQTHTHTHNGRPTGNTIVMSIRNMQISIELLAMEKFKKIEKIKFCF